MRFQWIEATGKDAADFFQRLSTADVKGLAPGEGTWALFLSAVGRIVSVFWVWRLPDGKGLGFEVPVSPVHQWPERFLKYIDDLHFGEDLGIQKGPTGSEPFPAPPELAALTKPKLMIAQPVMTAFHASLQWGQPTCVVYGAEGPLVDAALLTRSRIEALIPGVDQEIVPDANPLDIGFFEAIHPNKGCYPGQEVIERTLAKGSPAKRLVLARGKAPASGWVGLTVLPKADAVIGKRLSFGGAEATIEKIKSPS